MENNHKCKLCLMSFGNGKALGGHMRSHVMNLCKKSEAEQSSSEETTGSIPPSSSQEYDDDEDGNGGGDDSVVLQEEESESEMYRHHVGPTPRSRRSKRARKHVPNQDQDHNQTRIVFLSSRVSSISHTSPEEDVAYSLMLLSKVNWTKGEEEDDDSSKGGLKKQKEKVKYKCESCNKVFKSYQALGGHRASHKKMKTKNLLEKKNDENVWEIDDQKEKIHECPICYRVFSSGQALGGHKRSHFITSSSVIIDVEKQTRNLIDLNFPASIDDDDDDDDDSQIEVSAVSDSCFLRPH